MKKVLLLLVALCIFQGITKAQTKEDTLAVRETVSNYIEGWYSGDGDRMAKSLHTALAKRGIVPAQDGSGLALLPASCSDMIGWTKQSPNRLKSDPSIKNSINIIIFEIGVNVADVKCISKEFIDYLHLARTKDGWKILNAIWEPNYDALKTK